MDATDRLISSFYQQAAATDCWREFRRAGLAQLCCHFDALDAVWWTHGADGAGGELTEFVAPSASSAETATTTADQLQAWRSANAAVSGLIALMPPEAPGFALLRGRGRGETQPQTLLRVRFAEGTKLPSRSEFSRTGGHLLEAEALALAQFVGRDDWLHALGRANRGSAALVDAAGTVYAASPRFAALLEETALAPSGGRLGFKLPEHALGIDGGDFAVGPLHLRVAPQGALLLLHARRPLPLDALSPREQEIARALSDGKTLKSIARQYGIAVSTVANHTTRIYRKLAIFRREELVELIRGKPHPRNGKVEGR